MVDVSGSIVHINLAASSHLGYTPSQLTNKNIDCLLPRLLQARHSEAKQAASSQKEHLLVARHKDGSLVALQARGRLTGELFLVEMRINKTLPKPLLLLTCKDGLIRDASSNSTQMLGVPMTHLLQGRRINIKEVLPGYNKGDSSCQIHLFYEHQADFQEQTLSASVSRHEFNGPVLYRLMATEKKESTDVAWEEPAESALFQMRYDLSREEMVGEYQ